MEIQNLYGLGDYSTKQIQEFADLIKEEGLSEGELFARRPDAAPSPVDAIRAMDADNAPYIVPDAFAGTMGLALAGALTLQQLQAIGAEGDGNLKETIRMKFEELIKKGEMNDDIKKKYLYIAHSPAWQI